ncbi:hypothetical protein BH10ACI1_BH10ACI1_35770 [soil metagenome]
MSKNRTLNDGFSIVELLVVLVIISVMAGISGYFFSAHQKLYKPDDQSLKMVDILQEARQRALTQRESIRVEINTTLNIARIIDENSPTTANDDREIRRITLFDSNEVKITSRPGNISYNPPEPLPAPNAVFMASNYPTSSSQNVCTLRFQSNGTVLNAGNDAIGTGSVPTGVTLHIWSLKAGTTNYAETARSITIIGSSGSLRFWEFDYNSTDSNKWKDSRRTSVYGQ